MKFDGTVLISSVVGGERVIGAGATVGEKTTGLLNGNNNKGFCSVVVGRVSNKLWSLRVMLISAQLYKINFNIEKTYKEGILLIKFFLWTTTKACVSCCDISTPIITSVIAPL
jgi:hypothetical protein